MIASFTLLSIVLCLLAFEQVNYEFIFISQEDYKYIFLIQKS